MAVGLGRLEPLHWALDLVSLTECRTDEGFLKGFSDLKTSFNFCGMELKYYATLQVVAEFKCHIINIKTVDGSNFNIRNLFSIFSVVVHRNEKFLLNSS